LIEFTQICLFFEDYGVLNMMAAMQPNSPGVLPIKPISLSPKSTLIEAPLGVAYDVLIKPPSASKAKFVEVKSFSPKESLEERMRKAEERKMSKIQDQNDRQNEKYEKVKITQRMLFEETEKKEQEVCEKLQKKLQTAQENYDAYINQRKETCAKHVEKAKENAAQISAMREQEEKERHQRLLEKLQTAHNQYTIHLNERKEKCAREVEKAKEIAASVKSKVVEGEEQKPRDCESMVQG